MLDADTITLLEAGSALIVGTVSPHGIPNACRGWGLDVVSVDPCRVRLLLDVHEDRARANLEAGRPVAITCADVATLVSVQLKGTSAGIDASRADDEARMARYADLFYSAIEVTDRTPRDVIERLTPDALMAVVVDVVEQFDQTPGPAAGRPIVGPHVARPVRGVAVRPTGDDEVAS